VVAEARLLCRAQRLLAGSYRGPGPRPSTNLSLSQTASPSEFRPYRRFVSWFVLVFVILGSAYLLVSVAVSIYRRRHAVPAGAQVSAQATDEEIRSCYEELEDVTTGLAKHLENFHHLLAGYDPEEAQRWSDEGTVWRGQWRVLGKRCRFDEIRGGKLRKELEQMAAVYEELGLTQQIYDNELLRFGRDQAPRLDRIRKRIQRIGERMAGQTTASPGESDHE
jgi:hypothetical protein